MEKNTYVIIVASPELSAMKLEKLAGYRGIAVEELVLQKSKSRGSMVFLEKSYQDEFLWFIPETALRHE